MKTTATAMLTVLLAVACAEGPPRKLPLGEVESWTQGVERMEVRDADGKVLRTITHVPEIRAFLQHLPPSEFDDVFQESGKPQYAVEIFGPGRFNNVFWITPTHLRYPGKGAVKLRGSERTAILESLGLPDS